MMTTNRSDNANATKFMRHGTFLMTDPLALWNEKRNIYTSALRYAEGSSGCILWNCIRKLIIYTRTHSS
jgi:hypothetical protein